MKLPRNAKFFAAASVIAPTAARADLINLIPDGDFEGVRVRPGDTREVATYGDWSLSSSYAQYANARIAGAGAMNAPAQHADGGFTRNWLAIYDYVEINFRVPVDAAAGPQNATLSFDYWNDNSQVEYNYTMVNWGIYSQGQTSTTLWGRLSPSRLNWQHVTTAFSLIPGEEYRLRLSKNTSYYTGWAGIDRVRLEVDIPAGGAPLAVTVPEPASGLLAMLGAWICARCSNARRKLSGKPS